jgi:hypothetical protein
MTNQIAKVLNVSPEQIKSVREMAWVYCVVVYGRRATFVSKKAIHVQPQVVESVEFDGPAGRRKFVRIENRPNFDGKPFYQILDLNKKVVGAAGAGVELEWKFQMNVPELRVLESLDRLPAGAVIVYR